MADLNLKKTPQLVELVGDSKVLTLSTEQYVFSCMLAVKILLDNLGCGGADEPTTREDPAQVDEFSVKKGRILENSYKFLI